MRGPRRPRRGRAPGGMTSGATARRGGPRCRARLGPDRGTPAPRGGRANRDRSSPVARRDRAVHAIEELVEDELLGPLRGSKDAVHVHVRDAYRHVADARRQLPRIGERPKLRDTGPDGGGAPPERRDAEPERFWWFAVVSQ